MVITTSAGGRGPEVGLATIRVTTTERTELQPDRLGRGRRVGLGQQVVAVVLVGVRQDQPARGQHRHRQVPADLVPVEGRLVVHEEGDDLLAGDRALDALGHDSG